MDTFPVVSIANVVNGSVYTGMSVIVIETDNSIGLGGNRNLNILGNSILLLDSLIFPIA